MDTAIQAIRFGAYDYLTKPFDLDWLRILTERCLDESRLKRELEPPNPSAD